MSEWFLKLDFDKRVPAKHSLYVSLKKWFESIRGWEFDAGNWRASEGQLWWKTARPTESAIMPSLHHTHPPAVWTSNHNIPSDFQFLYRPSSCPMVIHKRAGFIPTGAGWYLKTCDAYWIDLVEIFACWCWASCWSCQWFWPAGMTWSCPWYWNMLTLVLQLVYDCTDCVV